MLLAFSVPPHTVTPQSQDPPHSTTQVSPARCSFVRVFPTEDVLIGALR